nr:hypothetical protein 9 [Campylobacterota bacterium]
MYQDNDTTTRFRPYLKQSTVSLLERTRDATGLSLGKVLMTLLAESDTFVKLHENEDKPDKDLKNIFLGLYLEK